MKTLAAALLLTWTASAQAQTPVEYRFDEVKRTVTLTSAGGELKVEKGRAAQGGDKVHTGWFSYALIATERYRAKFEIFSSTDVQLAEGTPGVILSVERGRIRAMFDKIVGSEPRIVKTPGALLAVRGTQFDVEVDEAGRTSVAVYEGMVEVRSPLLPQPLMVRPGESATYGRHEPPTSRPMGQRGENIDASHRGPNEPGHGGHDDHGQPHGTPPPPPPGKKP